MKLVSEIVSIVKLKLNGAIFRAAYSIHRILLTPPPLRLHVSLAMQSLPFTSLYVLVFSFYFPTVKIFALSMAVNHTNIHWYKQTKAVTNYH